MFEGVQCLNPSRMFKRISIKYIKPRRKFRTVSTFNLKLIHEQVCSLITLASEHIRSRSTAPVRVCVFVSTVPTRKVLTRCCGSVDCSCTESITRSGCKLFPEQGAEEVCFKHLRSIILPLLGAFPAWSNVPSLPGWLVPACVCRPDGSPVCMFYLACWLPWG